MVSRQVQRAPISVNGEEFSGAGGDITIAGGNGSTFDDLEWINLESYAPGDDTDRGVAIQNALDAAEGKVLYVRPDGRWRTSGQLQPPDDITIIDPAGAWRYTGWSQTTNATSKFKPAAGFPTDTALFGIYGASNRFLGIGIDGEEIGTDIHGMEGFDIPQEEHNLFLSGIRINRMTGDGQRGEFHVLQQEWCHVAANHGFGWNTTEGWVDCWFDNNTLNNNSAGGALFDHSSSSTPQGMIHCENLRCERNGFSPSSSDNYTTNANGIGLQFKQIRHARFINIHTDANPLGGIDVENKGSSSRLYDLTLDHLTLRRDGQGDTLTDPEGFALRMRNTGSSQGLARVFAKNVSAHQGWVIDGEGGSAPYQHPKYPIWCEDVRNSELEIGRISRSDGQTQNNFYGGAAGWEALPTSFKVTYTEGGLMSIAAGNTASRPTQGAKLGMLRYNTQSTELEVYVGGGTWRTVALA